MKRIYLISALLILISCKGSKSEVSKGNAKEEAVPVQVKTPIFGKIERPIFLTGKIRGIREVKVFPDLPGKFKKFAVNQGERVNKDQVILWLERDVPGLKYPPIPVKAPVGGIVSLRPLEEGQLITPNTSVATILESDSVKVIFHLPEKYAYQLKVGDLIQVRRRDGSWRKARVIWLSSLLDPISHTREVHAVLPNKGGEFLPGGVCEVKVPVERKEKALLIPLSAVMRDLLPFVFVVDSGIAKKRAVRIGITDFIMVEILDGLSPEDSVVVKGQTLLKEGTPVKVVREGS